MGNALASVSELRRLKVDPVGVLETFTFQQSLLVLTDVLPSPAELRSSPWPHSPPWQF